MRKHIYAIFSRDSITLSEHFSIHSSYMYYKKCKIIIKYIKYDIRGRIRVIEKVGHMPQYEFGVCVVWCFVFCVFLEKQKRREYTTDTT